ncbi:MAG: hypothetical protein V4819_19585 [Verrucomicrobiota bacterium]
MNKPVPPKRFPGWLRGLGWLAFSLLGLVTILVVARWLVMDSGHQATKRIVGSQRKKAVPQPQVAAVVPAATPRGMPLASVPHFGGVLVGDNEAWKEFSKKLDEITAFLRYKRTHREKVDGVWSFRAVLQNIGIEVPETMTEAEAAGEYLKQADRFSGLLAQWREAVAKGPLEKAADDKSDPNIWRFSWMASTVAGLLAMTGEAHLQAGDTANAWTDCQTLKNSDERVKELFPLDSYYGCSERMNYQLFRLAKSGVQSGAWTDEQLAELSSEAARASVLASAQRDAEQRKESITDYYMNFHEHEEQFGKDFLKTPSQFDQFVNQVKLKLITEQQIRDNMEVALFEKDQELSRFDPETGFYVRPTEEELADARGAKETPRMFDSFYFMIKGHGGDDQWTARHVIGQQSEYDQFRLAAALEIYQRQTGEYPDRLDAISGKFPNGAPLDIATGQPYLYQRNADGGYTLWGTGIDGKSEGGNEKTDVTWTHRPVKGK